MNNLLYSSKQVDKVIEIYSHEDEKYIQAERLCAQILILNQKERLKIRDYNNTFNQ